MRANTNIVAMIFYFFLTGLVLLSTSNVTQAADENVRKAQQMLSDLGYQPGPVDGMFGPSTRKAIEKYQIDNNLPNTGEIDKATAKSLGVEIVKNKTLKDPNRLVEVPPGQFFSHSEECMAIWKCPNGKDGCSMSEGKFMIPAHCLSDGGATVYKEQ